MESKYPLKKVYMKRPKGVERTGYSVYHKDFGALEFWYSPNPQIAGMDLSKYYGGVEHHMNKAPYYMDESKPSHEYCSTVGGKCWHDGSSLAFDRYESAIGDDDHIFSRLELELDEILGDTE